MRDMNVRLKDLHKGQIIINGVYLSPNGNNEKLIVYMKYLADNWC